jgi:hypothetical protein
MAYLKSALQAVGGGEVNDVTPASMLGSDSPGSSHGDANSGFGSGKTSDQPVNERAVSLG